MIKLYNFVIEEGNLIRYNGFDSDITIPAGVKKIGNSSFSFCKTVKIVHIPKGTVLIMPGAFFNCPQLCELDMGECTAKIDNKMFISCRRFTDITVSPKNTHYKSIDGVLFDKSGKKLILVPEGRTGEYTVPHGVKEICSNAFSGCIGLTKINIQEGVVKIGDSAFSGCKGITEMKLPKSAKKIGEKVFWCCTRLSNVTIQK